MKNNEIFNVNKAMSESFDYDQIRRDAEASLKKNIDSQSDARIAKLKAGEPKKSFMGKVGDKIIAGVGGAAKGAYKGFTTGQMKLIHITLTATKITSTP
jgi:hypothetical protein